MKQKQTIFFNAYEFGERITYIRTTLSLTQKELSNRMDMDDGSIRRIESGRPNPTLATINKVAIGLKTPLYVLFLPKEKLDDFLDIIKVT